MNLRVTCIDSGRTQRASGANPRTPSRNCSRRAANGIVDIESNKDPHRAVVSRRSSVVSKHDSARCPAEPAVADDRRLKTDDCSTSVFFSSCPAPAGWRTSGCVCDRRGNFSPPLRCLFRLARAMEDQAHRLFRRAARRAGHACNADSQRRAAALANSLGQRGRHFAADRAVLFDQLRGNIGESRLQLVGVNHRSAQEVTRAAADRSDALRQQARRCRTRPPPAWHCASACSNRRSAPANLRCRKKHCRPVPLRFLPPAGPRAACAASSDAARVFRCSWISPAPPGSWSAHRYSACRWAQPAHRTATLPSWQSSEPGSP